MMRLESVIYQSFLCGLLQVELGVIDSSCLLLDVQLIYCTILLMFVVSIFGIHCLQPLLRVCLFQLLSVLWQHFWVILCLTTDLVDSYVIYMVDKADSH